MTWEREGTGGLADRITEAARRRSHGGAVDRKRVSAVIRSRRRARIEIIGGLGLGILAATGMALGPGLLDFASPEPLPSPSTPSDTYVDPGPADYDSWWGTCESHPLGPYPPGPTDTFDLATDLEPGTMIDDGANLEFTATLTALMDAEVWTRGIDVAFLFDERVVGVAKSDEVLQIRSFAGDSTTAFILELPVLLCDGTSPLWPGDYEVIVSLGYDTEMGDDRGGGAESFPRVTSEPVPFTIAGDRSANPLLWEDPFSPDQGTVSLPPPYPDDALTAEALILMIEASATDTPWDMAPGTSRWSVPEPEAYNPYYPTVRCWFGGQPFEGLPESMANLDFIRTEADIPEHLDIRYGWVVQGPPYVSVTFTNLTDQHISGPGHSAAQFYGNIILVKDGVVVAMGSLQDVLSDSRYYYFDQSDELMADPVEYYNLLRPRESRSHRTVWMTITACRATADQVVEIPSGTYTALFGLEFYAFGDYQGIGSLVQWTSLGTIEVDAG